MPLARWHDFFSQSLAHSERVGGLLLLGLLVIAAVSFGALLRRQVRKSWLGEATKGAASGWLSAGAWALRLAALLLVGVAAADPRVGRGTSDAGRSSEQIVLLLDRSRSMLAADAEPTRFGLARHLAADVIDRSQGAAVAIVSFAGDARVESPLSRDDRQLREQLDALDPERDASPGTLLTQGLMLAADCFATRFVGPKRLIVLTDGETQEPVPLAGVTLPKGVDVLFLGIGDSQNGARIPLKKGETDNRFDSPQYLTHEGKTVWTKAHPEILRALARQLGGRSEIITSVREGSQVISAARGEVPEPLRWERLQTATPIYATFLSGALALLVVESLLPTVWSLCWFGASRRHRRTTTPIVLSMLGLCFLSGASPRPGLAETYNRGVEAYRSAAWQEAEAQFRQVIETGEEPFSSRARFNLANTLYQRVRAARMSKQEAMSRLEECIACYRRAIQDNERPADARANLQIAYTLLKRIENQEATDRQSGRDDADQGSASPPETSQRRGERGEGDKLPPPGERPGSNGNAGDASKPNKPDQPATSPPADATGGQVQNDLTDAAAEDELKRIRDQARRRGSGKKPVLARPTIPGGLPW